LPREFYQTNQLKRVIVFMTAMRKLQSGARRLLSANVNRLTERFGGEKWRGREFSTLRFPIDTNEKRVIVGEYELSD
jgi:hypothetical protein